MVGTCYCSPIFRPSLCLRAAVTEQGTLTGGRPGPAANQCDSLGLPILLPGESGLKATSRSTLKGKDFIREQHAGWAGVLPPTPTPTPVVEYGEQQRLCCLMIRAQAPRVQTGVSTPGPCLLSLSAHAKSSGAACPAWVLGESVGKGVGHARPRPLSLCLWPVLPSALPAYGDTALRYHPCASTNP